MSVVNGQLANQTTFNNAFMSRTASTTSTVAAISLGHPDSDAISDIQKFTGQIAESVGMVEDDPAKDDYSSENFISDGDSRKVAIGKLDAQLGVVTDDVADHETRISTIEANNTEDVDIGAFSAVPSAEGLTVTGQTINMDPADETHPGGVSTGAQDFGGTKTFKADVVVEGDLTVLGDNFSALVTDMEVEDRNILVNKNGNDGTAEGAGLDVERPAGNAGIRFDSSLASKWKIGLLLALYEVVVSGIAQTIAGVKTFSSAPILDSLTASQPIALDGSKQIKTMIKNGERLTIANAAQTKAVTFPVAFPNTNYTLKVEIENLTDADPIFLERVITARSLSGFTVKFNTPTDSANYVLHYEAVQDV